MQLGLMQLGLMQLGLVQHRLRDFLMTMRRGDR